MKPIFKIKNWQLLKARDAEGRIVLPKGDFVAIGKRAFAGKQNPYLESVTVPEGISVIKAEAFSECKNLRTVILSTGGNIGLSQGVFAGCTRLREVANRFTPLGLMLLQVALLCNTLSLAKICVALVRGHFQVAVP